MEEVETKLVEDKNEKEVEAPPAGKRKYTKRKKVEEAEEKTESFQEPKEGTCEDPVKKQRIRVTAEEEETKTESPEEPSFLRGAIVKPVLLGLLAAGSFYVNQIFVTSKKQPNVEKTPLQSNAEKKKKNSQKTTLPFNLLYNRPKIHSVPGFN
jgi:hypothetical protein